MDINRWSRDAALNNANAPDGAKEGWFGGEVNAWARETMSQVRIAWETDKWRALTVTPLGGHLTVTRDSDTQITIGAIDLSAVLAVGQRIRVTDTGAANESFGTVTSVTYSAPDTIVVISVDEGVDADGTALLTTGNLSFTAGAPGSITRTSGSWVADGFVSGDRLRITGTTSNNGFYTVSNVLALTMDLTPVGQYAVITAGAAAGNAYRIQTVDALIAGPLEDVFVAGAHTDDARMQDLTGPDPLEFVTHELLGSAAYKREADLSVADSLHADDADTLAGSAPGPGNGLDADTVDGVHASGLGPRRYLEILESAYDQTAFGSDIEVFDIVVPGGDGVREFYFSTHQVYTMTTSGNSNTTITLRLGPNGTMADTALDTLTQGVYDGGTFTLNMTNYSFTPASGDHLSFWVSEAGVNSLRVQRAATPITISKTLPTTNGGMVESGTLHWLKVEAREE